MEIAFGADIDTISSFMVSVYNSLNEGSKSADMAVNAYKLIESMKDIKGRTSPTFKLIDLYTIREDDELTNFGGQHLKDKIDDWANIDMNFFLALSARLIPGFIDAYKRLSLSISTQKDKKKQSQ